MATMERSGIPESGGHALGVDGLSRILRDLIDAPIGDGQAWAQSAAETLVRPFGQLWCTARSPKIRLTVELVEPSTGRCLAVAGAEFGAPGAVHAQYAPGIPTAVLPVEKIVLEATGSRGGVVFRALVSPGEIVQLSAALENELRIIASAASELFESRVYMTIKRRREIMGRLTEAQQRVLRYMLEDLSEREIGERLERSQHTIHDHVKGIYASLGIASPAELLVLWHAPGPFPAGAPSQLLSPVMLMDAPGHSGVRH